MVGVLAILLPLLAVLQYRWIGQVSEADLPRLERTLRVTALGSARDIVDELDAIVNEFRLRRSGRDLRRPFDEFALEELSDDYEDWQATAAFPRLLRNVYVYREDEPSIQRFDPVTRTLTDASIPLEGLERWFDRPARDIPPEVLFERGLDGSQIWIVAAAVEAGQQFRAPGGRGGDDDDAWTIFEIDSEYFWTERVPAIIQARFDQEDFRVAVQDTLTGTFYYMSNDDMPEGIMEEAEVNFPISGRDQQFGVNFPISGRDQQFGIIGPRLRLAAQHELGSVAQAVEAARRRNLAVGFGMLALLGATGAMIIVWSERVRSVGRLQMEFAAGISHELRTPLATIRTAAHNIVAGVVKKPEEVREYAQIVEAEGRRLSAMVDQTIQFAQTEAGRRQYNLEPQGIDDVVARAVETALPSAEESGHRIAIRLDPTLPDVLADETALRHCVVNLLTNAIKFGPAGKEITIEAHHDTRARRILLGVHNEGPGIDADDMPNLFEPFYRGHETSHIPGSGLGLSLVRKMMVGQNGSVTVRSEAGHGATFTLHIPVAPPEAQPDAARVTA
jgi:signal transduction histidine kinase